MNFKPKFKITPTIASNLMKIEKIKEKIKNLPITPSVLKTLRETARLYSTHYSTQIEGNRLTQKEVQQVIHKNEHFAGRERDEDEIKGYYLALEWLEKNLNSKISEATIQKIHALVMSKGRSKVKLTPYRNGQNVIKDSLSGTIIYLPPEAKEVKSLMKEFIVWLNNQAELPCPIKAAIAHYQYVTIHPYYDGNGRTARLLTTMVLHQGGYDLKGLYALEEYYARNLGKYYAAISIGDHHNYYEGREKAEITSWIEYFIAGMVDSFEKVSMQAKEASGKGLTDKSKLIRTLNPKQRKILLLFTEQAEITSKDIRILFNFSGRSARKLCQDLVQIRFFEIVDHAKKSRSYKLADKFEKLVE